MKVLVADDDHNVRKLLELVLREDGYDPVLACDGRQALELFASEEPDAVVLDVMMPRMDGFEVCRRIREQGGKIPILMLSAKGDVIDRKTGLRNGADDYLAKPFDEEELTLRIGALLRLSDMRGKASGPEDPFASIGPFSVDQHKLSLSKDGRKIPLTVKESHIVVFMMEHAGQVISADALASAVWDDEYFDAASNIPVYIRHIRNKIEDDPSHPKYVITLRGRGYCFEP